MKSKSLSMFMLVLFIIQYLPITPVIIYGAELKSAVSIDADLTASVSEETEYTDQELINKFNVTTTASEGSSITVDTSAINIHTPADYPIGFTVTDAITNESATIERTITIRDVTPSISFERTHSSHQLGVTPDFIADSGATASEIATGDLTDQIVVDDSEVDYNQVGTYNVYYSVVDEEGNSVRETTTVAFRNDPPSIVGELEASIDEEQEPSNQELVDLFYIEAEDSDGVSLIEVDDQNVDYSTPGKYSLSATAYDTYDAPSLIHNMSLVVEDLLPTITLTSSNQTIQAATTPDYFSLFGPVATEITEGDLTSEITIDSSEVNVAESGEYPVIFKVVDEEGNVASETATLVVDYTPPTISADSSHFIYEEDIKTDQELLELFNVEYTTSGLSEVTVNQSAINYSTPGDYSIIFTVVDETGTSVSTTSTLTLLDAQPKLSFDSEYLVAHVGTKIDYIADFGAVATEFVPGDLNDTIIIDDTSVDINQVGVYPIYFSATDSEGTTITEEVTLSLKNEPPVITTKPEATIIEETSYTDQQLIDLYDVQAADEDGIQYITINDNDVNYQQPGDYNLTITATDSFDSTSLDHHVVLHITDVLPTITLGSDFQSIPAETIPDYVSLFEPVATEITEGDLTAEITTDSSKVELAIPGDYPVTFEVSDEEGNTTSALATLVVEYVEPTISADTRHQLYEEDIQTDDELLALFNVDVTHLGTASIEVDQSQIDYSTPGDYPIIFTVIDQYGTSVSTTSTLTLLDVEPKLTFEKIAVEGHIGNEINYVDAFGPVATEFVLGDLNHTIVIDDSSVDVNQVGEYQIYFSATDSEGTTITEEVTLTIENDSPVITSKSEATIDEETSYTEQQLIDLFEVQAADQDGILNIVIDDSSVNYDVPGTYSLSITATDSFGSASLEHDVILHITDILPTITLGRDEQSIPAETIPVYLSLFEPIATEITEGDLTSEIEIDSSKVDLSIPGEYSVNFEVSDEEGNTTTALATLVVEYVEPTISADTRHQLYEEDIQTDDELLALFNVDATHLGTASIEVDQSQIDYSTPGDYPIIFTVIDQYGTSVSTTSTLTLLDVEPKLTFESTVIERHVGSELNYIEDFGSVATEFILGDLNHTIMIDDSSVDVNQVGEYPVFFSATDSEGTTITEQVTLILENDSPVITNKSEATIDEGTRYSQQQLIDLFDVQADDQDGILNIVIDDSSVNYDVPGTYSLSITATDNFNGSSVQNVSLYINDVLPTIEVKNRIAFSHIEETIDYQLLFNYSATEFKDGDLTDMVIVDDSAVNYNEVGPYEIVFSVNDNDGNMVSKTRTLVITNDSPHLEAKQVAYSPEGIELSEQDLLHLFDVTIIDPDGTKDVIVDMSDVDFNTPDIYYVGFIAHDTYGKPSSKFYTKLIITDKLPEIELENNEVEIHIGDNLDFNSIFGASASELVAGDLTADIEVDSSEVDSNKPGTYPVVFSVTDDEGNIATITGYLTIENDQPQITGKSEIEIPEETELSSSQYLSELELVVEDSDPIESLVIDDSNIDYTVPGSYQLIITATDIYGAASQVTVIVNVVDMLPKIEAESDVATIEIGSKPDIIELFGLVGSEIITGDLTSQLVIDDSNVDYNTAGQYPVLISLTDQEQNTIQYQLTLIVNPSDELGILIDDSDESIKLSTDLESVDKVERIEMLTTVNQYSLLTTGSKILFYALIFLLVALVIKLLIKK